MFKADTELARPEGNGFERSGVIEGLIGWYVQREDLQDAGDAISGDADILGLAANHIRHWLKSDRRCVVDTVVVQGQ